jgi:4-hydroxy-tetrahydrodipicolinate synthase
MIIEGVCSVLPTPFKAGGEIDHESLARVTELAVAAGVRSVAALGITGEGARLTDRERSAVLETVVRAADRRVTVVAGTSADGLRTCIEFSREAMARGARAIVVRPPRLVRFSSEVVINHYRTVAEAVDLPIVVQDYPPACGYTLEAGLLARIGREVPAARTITLEDPPTPFKTTRVLAAAGETRLSVLGGLGGVFLLEELLAGAAGVMTGFAYPEVLVQIVEHYRAGRVDEAAAIFYRFLPLLRFEAQEGIGLAIRKELFRRRGALADASTRAPGAVLDDATRAALDRVLAWTARQEGGEIVNA